MRVGIDLVSILDVAASIARFNRAYLDRIFTARELEDSTGDADYLACRLAARFAAKEAATKVLRPGDLGLGWKSIEIQRSLDGSPELVLHGAALALAQAQALSNFSVSLSHEGAYATAVVIAS